MPSEIHSAAFFGSFPLEALADVRLGLALRALVSLAVLLGAARLHRPPSLPGLHRRLAWLGAWLLPAGFAIAAAYPSDRAAALHVTFVGGFAQLALAIGSHVVLSHGGRPERLSASPPAAWLLAACLAVAFAARLLAAADLRDVARWLAVAALAFAGAIGAWVALVGPALLAPPSAAPAPPGGGAPGSAPARPPEGTLR